MAKNKVGIGAFIKFYKENGKAFKAYPMRDKSRVQMTLCNMEIAKLDRTSEAYMKYVDVYNDAMIYHYAGKWLATKAIGSKAKSDWRGAFDAFGIALKIGKSLYDALQMGTSVATYDKPKLIRMDSEIQFFGEVPIVPEITPIVVLRGSSYEMGRQYCEQLIDIYGEWILTRHANRTFSEMEQEEIQKWRDIHGQYTPELLDFAKGWSDQALDCGIELSYKHVLDLWVGHKPPTASYLNAEAGIPELPPLACTALAAWGEATEDGELIVGATGDHDLSYQITIVMYPEDGNPLVFTPFEATGTLPTVGPNWFFGHPGMNSKGLAYVHHGGGPKMLEPRSEWGYGIRRGASVFHNLRYCDTTEEAYANEMAWPIGDIGYGDQATVGGFYADSQSGYVIESRTEPLCVRRPGSLGEKDYLFSNNSVMHKDAIESEWMSKIEDMWLWDEEGGWRPKEPRGMVKSMKMIFEWFTGRLKTDQLMSRGMNFAYWNSYNRNLFLNRMGKKYLGRLSLDTMKEVYRTTGTMPEGDFKALKKRYIETGEWGDLSAAHASNALVVLMKPKEGIYSLCTGPAKRGAAPISPDLAISIYNERNAFWTYKLTDSPEMSLDYVRGLAEELMQSVEDTMVGNQVANYEERLYNELRQLQDTVDGCDTTNNDLKAINRLTRLYTRIHVVARQLLKD